MRLGIIVSGWSVGGSEVIHGVHLRGEGGRTEGPVGEVRTEESQMKNEKDEKWTGWRWREKEGKER